MRYQPGLINSAGDVDLLERLLFEELQRLAASVDEVVEGRGEVFYVEPTKRQLGMKAFADGTDWDPGYGVGEYTWDGSAWVPTGILDTWHIVGEAGEPAFIGNWQNYDNSTGWPACGFRMKADGSVLIHGIIENGTTSSNIFNIPARYRPTNIEAGRYHGFHCYSDGSHGRSNGSVFVYEDGDILFNDVDQGTWNTSTSYLWLHIVYDPQMPVVP